MNKSKGQKIDRREFTRKAALLSAAMVPTGMAFEGPAAAATNEQLPEGAEKLSAEGRVEAEARFQQIMSQYGRRFDSEEQKLVHEGCYILQGSLERLRAFPLENGDAPALYLKPLLEREKKPQSAPAAGAAPAAAKKP
ncbi:MAG TPA: hypothetical protein VJY15_13775 [Candidatus Acidoferrum sp.]|nr:hypothetical protein [Candidatus Acidoferrum sp.]